MDSRNPLNNPVTPEAYKEKIQSALKQINVQREEIMKAFLAKHNCDVDNIIQIVRPQGDGSMRWYLHHATDDELKLLKAERAATVLRRFSDDVGTLTVREFKKRVAEWPEEGPDGLTTVWSQTGPDVSSPCVGVETIEGGNMYCVVSYEPAKVIPQNQ